MHTNCHLSTTSKAADTKGHVQASGAQTGQGAAGLASAMQPDLQAASASTERHEKLFRGRLGYLAACEGLTSNTPCTREAGWLRMPRNVAAPAAGPEQLQHASPETATAGLSQATRGNGGMPKQATCYRASVLYLPA